MASDHPEQLSTCDEFAEACKFWKVRASVFNDPHNDKCYRKLALKLHPDKGGSAEHFRELKRCHEANRLVGEYEENVQYEENAQ